MTGRIICYPAIKNDSGAICEVGWPTIWIADGHRDGNRFAVRADDKLAAFLELESAIRFLSRKIRRDFVELGS